MGEPNQWPPTSAVCTAAIDWCVHIASLNRIADKGDASPPNWQFASIRSAEKLRLSTKYANAIAIRNECRCSWSSTLRKSLLENRKEPPVRR